MVTNIPPGIWIRILILCYKARNRISAFLGFLGMKTKLSWSEYDLSIKILAFPLSRFNPDIVVGVGVGGSILAATLAGNLGKPFLATDRDVDWDNERNVNLVDASITDERTQLLVHKKVLLTSAEIISGKTTKKLKEYVQQFNPKEIKVACIDYNPTAASEITPDHCYLTSSRIIQKPWRILETYPGSDDNQRK